MPKPTILTIDIHSGENPFTGSVKVVIDRCVTPSNAAKDLGVCRQSVNQYLRTGKLDWLRLEDTSGRLIAILVDSDSVKRLKKHRSLINYTGRKKNV